MRGDLIETFKIVNEHVNYGTDFFGTSLTGRHLISKPCTSKFTTNKRDFFAQRVLHYWNKLPEKIRKTSTVNSFKNQLDSFRVEGIKKDLHGHFWELSDEFFNRIEVDAKSRLNYTEYMRSHAYYAKYRQVNIN